MFIASIPTSFPSCCIFRFYFWFDLSFFSSFKFDFHNSLILVSNLLLAHLHVLLLFLFVGTLHLAFELNLMFLHTLFFIDFYNSRSYPISTICLTFKLVCRISGLYGFTSYVGNKIFKNALRSSPTQVTKDDLFESSI